MGPYIVTTKRPARADWARFAHASVSRLAVATLEEDELAERLFDGRTDTFNAAYIIGQVSRLPESGGTVGPLPDGTEIEVEQISWARLANATALFDSGNEIARREILDAYNAQQKAAA